MADNLAHPYNRRKSLIAHWLHLSDCWLIRSDVVGQVVTIDDLPDDVLLEIFDFYVFRYQYRDHLGLDKYDMKREIESWQLLVQVCRRWRGLVFASPRRLNLQLFCIPGTSARQSLDVWPALPLHIDGGVTETSVFDIFAELEHSDRIYQINLALASHTPSSDQIWMAMQVPFPELAVLHLSFGSLYDPVLPADSFLGGSAPRLRCLALTSVPLPELPETTFCLPRTQLVEASAASLYSSFRVHLIRGDGYFSLHVDQPRITST